MPPQGKARMRQPPRQRSCENGGALRAKGTRGRGDAGAVENGWVRARRLDHHTTVSVTTSL
jgi:hypothetical protein